MLKAKNCILSLLAVSLLVLLGSCANPAASETWSPVSNYDQVIGTWQGSTTITVPASQGTPAYDMAMDVTYTFEADYSMIAEAETDMSALINYYESQMAGFGDQFWTSMSAMAGTQTDPETGMEVTISFSDGSPYIMTTTTTGTIDPDDLTTLSDADINKTGTQLRVQEDDGADGVITLILTKQ